MASTSSIPSETRGRCDADKVKVGDTYTRHSVGTIKKIENVFNRQTQRYETVMMIENSNGDVWTVGKEIIGLEFSIAEQFDEEEAITRTRMIEILTEHPRTAMTVNFNKKPDPKAAAKLLEEGKGKLSSKAWNAKVAEAMAGEERTMVGYHALSFDEHRRLRFQETGKGQRLVDPKTLNWLIVDRVKYVLKK